MSRPTMRFELPSPVASAAVSEPFMPLECAQLDLVNCGGAGKRILQRAAEYADVGARVGLADGAFAGGFAGAAAAGPLGALAGLGLGAAAGTAIGAGVGFGVGAASQTIEEWNRK